MGLVLCSLTGNLSLHAYDTHIALLRLASGFWNDLTTSHSLSISFKYCH